MRNFDDFDKRMASDRRTFNILFRVVAGFIALVFVLQLAFWGFAAITIGKMDFSQGVKPVLEKIWCGAPGCLK